MEITYETIVKYLSKKRDVFLSDKDKTNYSFPDKFKDIFPKEIYRVGISSLDIYDYNVSFITSILFLLNNNFIAFSKTEKIEAINKIYDLMDERIKKRDIPTSINISKKELQTIIKNRSDSVYIYEFISYIFDINFLIFNFEDLKIYSIFRDDTMNPWKPVFLIAKHKEHYEPIKSYEHNNFSYNDNFIKEILNGKYDIEYYNTELIKKEYSVVDNIEEIVNDMIDIDMLKQIDKELDKEKNSDTKNEDEFNKQMKEQQLQKYEKLLAYQESIKTTKKPKKLKDKEKPKKEKKIDTSKTYIMKMTKDELKQFIHKNHNDIVILTSDTKQKLIEKIQKKQQV